MPELVTQGEPPSVRSSIGFAFRRPYVDVGLGATSDFYPTSWLRVGVVAEAGLAFKRTDEGRALAFGYYVEGALGFRLWGWASQVDADLPLRYVVGNRSGVEAEESLPVWLPSSHRFYVEGGLLGGPVQLRECTTGCAAGQVPEYRARSVSVLTPFAGLRYVYYSGAWNDKPPIRRVRYGQLFVHVMKYPFDEPAAVAYLADGARAKLAPAGFRAGGDLPATPWCAATGGGCWDVGGAIGYAPYPALVSVELHIRMPLR